MVESTYKHIFCTPCPIHVLNNALKDWVKTTLVKARDIEMFVTITLTLCRSYSKKKFLKLDGTRQASYFILLERMLEVWEALQSMVVCEQCKKWAQSKTKYGKVGEGCLMTLGDPISNEKFILLNMFVVFYFLLCFIYYIFNLNLNF